MAVVFKFRRDTTDLSLLAGAGSGWRAGVWNAKVGTPVYGRRPLPVTEAIDCLVDRGAHDDLATSLQAMDDMREGAARYKGDRLEQYPVWLHVKMNNETGERRALVREIEEAWLSSQVDVANEAALSDARVRLTVKREGVWEGTALVSMASATPAAAAALVHDYTSGVADVVGDAPARLGALHIASERAYQDPVGRVWVGLRSATKHGTLANFIPIWECEDTGCTLGTDAAIGADGTASGGSRVRITPGTATWAKRLTMPLVAFTTNEEDNFGRFLRLLRHKVSAGTWEVQLRTGYTAMADADFAQGPIVQVTNTAWDYVEAGIADVPLRHLHGLPTSGYSDAYEKTYAIQIWARRTVGAGTLDLDCVCPVPVDEGFVSSSGFSLAGLAAGEAFWTFAEGPDGVIGCIATNGGVTPEFAAFPVVSADAFRLPPGDGRMVIVHAQATLADITDRVQISGYYYPCWYNLRGAE